MRKIAALALFLGVSAGAAPAPAPAGRLLGSERVANNDAYNEFPRWHSFVNVLNRKDGSGNRLTLGRYMDIQTHTEYVGVAPAFDPRGYLHVVGVVSPAVFGTDRAQIAYFDTRTVGRRANGFTPPFAVSTNGAVGCSGPDIVATEDGTVHVIWEQGTSSQNFLITDVYYRSRSAAGVWSAPINLTNNTASGPGVTNRYSDPCIARDHHNNIHVVFYQIDVDTNPPTHDYRAIWYSLNPQSAGGWASLAQWSGPDNALPRPVRIACRTSPGADTSNAQVAWEQLQTSVNTRAQTNGTWGATTLVASSANRPDLDVDTAGAAHFAYVSGGTVTYKLTAAGTPELVGTGSDPQIEVDSRGQPNVVYRNGQLSYGLRVGTSWTKQDPIQEIGRQQIASSWPAGVPRIARDASDRLVLVEDQSGLCSWTYEPNLGEGDAFATFPWGPNASADSATGNLSFALSLFASKGVGFAASCALTYNSLDPEPDDLSRGWRRSYSIRIVDDATGSTNGQDSLTLVFPDGRSVILRWNAVYGYLVADDEYGYFSKIVRTDVPSSTDYIYSTYVLTTKFGIKYSFDVKGRLEKIEDTQSPANAINFTYTSDLLTSILDSAGRTTSLQYDAQNRLLKVIDPASGNYDLVYETTTPPELGKLQLVKFSSGPAIPKWKFEYHASDDGANEMKRHLLSKIYTPRGEAGGYSWSLGYWPDGRARTCTDPWEVSIINETNIDGGVASTQGQRHLDYSDPAEPFGKPNTTDDDPNTVPAVPAAKFTNRRGYVTTVEYQYRRALADKVFDAQSPTRIVRRYFDGYNFADPPSSVPQFRNLIRFTDKRGYSTDYTYATGTPPHVKDNLQYIDRPLIQTETANRIEYTYTTDSLNRVATVTDAKGNVTSYAYFATGDLQTITYPDTQDADGGWQTASESFTYDTKGRVTSSTDAENHQTTFQYNDPTTGLVTHILRAGGGPAEILAYNALGVTTNHTLPEGGQTVYTLDGLYRIDYATDPLGKITDLDYDVDSNLVWTKDPKNNIVTSVFDKLGRLTSTTAPAGTSSFEYDREGNTRKTKDPNANAANPTYYTTKSLFDELNRPKDERRDGTAPGNSVEHRTTTTYDANGNVQQRTAWGSTNRVTDYQYDARNNLKETSYPIGTITDHNCYDKNDNLTFSQRRRNDETPVFKYATSNDYDQRNRLRSSTQVTSDPGAGCPTGNLTGITTKYFYNRNSSGTKVKDPTGKTREWTYDARERQELMIDGAGVQISKNVYNQNDLPIEGWTRTTAGTGVEKTSEVHYDARNVTDWVKDAFSNQTSFEHDDNGNPTKRTDPALTDFTTAFDSSDRPTNDTSDPPGLNVQVAYPNYDGNGNPLRTAVFNPATGANDAYYDNTYDRANRLVAMRSPLYPTCPDETWQYDAFGQLAVHTDRNGKVATYTYNDMGWLVTETHGAPFNKTIARTYDGAGNLKSIDDGTVRIDYTYDNLNRLLSASWTVSGSAYKSISYTYDDAGNRITMTDPEGAAFTYGYNANNRPTTIVRNGITYATTSYYPGGQKKEIVLGNGAKYTFALDKKDRVTSVKTLSSGGGVIAGFDYTYDSRDNRTKLVMTHLGVTIEYGHDSLSRVTSEAWSGSICPEPVVNQFTSQPAGNESGFSNEVSTAPKAAILVPAYFGFFTFDKAGNRTEISAIDRRSTYTYDAENRLTSETVWLAQKVSLVNVSASDTETGFSAATAADGVTLDSTGSSYVWKSTNAASQHWVELAFVDGDGNPTNQLVGQVRCYLPTTVGGVSKFKVQYWSGTAWNDLTVLAVSGAELASGWYKAQCHEVTFGFAPVSTQKVRYLQDVGGGGSSPNVAYLNELEAYAFFSQAPVVYTYDCNGNLKSRTQDVIKETYGYDYANRMTSYTKENTATVQTLSSWTYLIGPTGDRVNKQDVLANTKEWYMYRGDDVITDYTQAGAGPITLQYSYVDDLGIDKKIARIGAGGATVYFAPDALGSAHETLDSTGQTTDVQLTDAWGNKLPGFSYSSTTSTRYGFSQRENDSESGLQHFRARSYDPRTGRFTSKDPLLAKRVHAHYLYGRNNPLRYTDPMGLQEQDPRAGTRTANEVRGWLRNKLGKFGGNRVADVLEKSPPGILLKANVDFVTAPGATLKGLVQSAEESTVGAIQRESARLEAVADVTTRGESNPWKAGGGGGVGAVLILVVDASGAMSVYEGVSGTDTTSFLETGNVRKLDFEDRFERTTTGGVQLLVFSAGVAEGMSAGSAGSSRTYKIFSREGPQGTGRSGPLSLEDVRKLGEANEIDMRMFELRFESGPYFGNISQRGFGGALMRAPNGRFWLTLSEKGLASEEAALHTVAHELNHARSILRTGFPTEEGVADIAGDLSVLYKKK